MVACVALAIHGDPVRLKDLLHSDPDLFDAIWYVAFPPKQEAGSDIDQILQSGK